MRQITDTDLVGKTIQSIDAKAINVLRLTFTDNSTAELWAEGALMTPAGVIPGIFIEDNPDPNVEMTEVQIDHCHDESCNHG